MGFEDFGNQGTPPSEYTVPAPINPSRSVIYSAPWSVTDDFKEACRSGKQIPIVLVQALNQYMIPVADITEDVEDGSVTIDVNRGTRRTLQLRLTNEGGKYTPNDSSDYFFWNNLIRVYRGLRYISSTGNEVDEYVCLGTFLVDRPEVFVERNMSVITIDGSDLYKKIATGGFASEAQFPKGTLVGEIILRILNDALISPWQTCIYSQEDEDDVTLSTNLVTNYSFETNTTGWDSPAAPTHWTVPSLGWSVKPYYGSGATLARVSPTVKAPYGDTYALSVTGASCRAAHCTISSTFTAGTTYYIRAFVRKQVNSASYSFVNSLIGNSAYFASSSPYFTADIANGSTCLFSWPDDADAMTADMKTYYALTETPYQQISMTWKPARTYTSAELYFYCYNIALVPSADAVAPLETYDYVAVEDATWSRDYYIDSIYVGTLTEGDLETDRRTTKEISWTYGDSRDQLLQSLLAQYNLEGYFDVYGIYRVVKKKDPTIEPSIWTFSASDDSTMLGISRIQDDLQLLNHIIVTNEGSGKNATVVAEREVTDTASPYHKSRIGDRVMVLKMQQISTSGAAAAAADAAFLKYCSIAETLKLPTICLPFLEGNDVVTVTETMSGTDDNYLCTRFSIPLRETRMDIESIRTEAVT